MNVNEIVGGANPDRWVGSSMVEQRPFKPLAVGSSPTRPTILFIMNKQALRLTIKMDSIIIGQDHGKNLDQRRNFWNASESPSNSN